MRPDDQKRAGVAGDRQAKANDNLTSWLRQNGRGPGLLAPAT